MSDSKWIPALIAGALLASGCAATSSSKQVERLESVKDNPRIVLMPPDIRYYLITTGGIPEPHAEWTTAARENFAKATEAYAESIGANLKILDEANLSPTEIEYEQLHAAVGFTVLDSHFGAHKLPGKGDAFDWSLGPGVREIAEEHDADYALFVFYRDQQASTGRVAFAVIVAAATGMYPGSTGSEYGFASLVDLRTGDIVWFNSVAAGGGELRNPDGAAQAVKVLFKDIPANKTP